MRKLLFTLVLSVMALTSRAQNTLLCDCNRDGQVTIADAMMVIDVIIHGYAPFNVSPTEVTMPVGGSATVNIIGGYYLYEVTSANPDVVSASLSGTTVALTAVSGGETTVTVKDVQTFRRIEIPVKVNYNSLEISSSALSLIAGSQGTVSITSGSGSYSVESSDGNVATATVKNSKVTVTAIGAGTAAITVTDTKTGQTAVIDVTVDYQPLAISNSSLNLSIGDEETVSITSGSGSYSVESSDGNVATAEIDGSTITVIAFGGGSATITVTDTKSGQTQTIAVTVEYFPLTLSATSLSLNVGEESTVSITSGNASYSVKSSDTGVATASVAGFSIKVTAIGAGSATITVTDRRSGQTATIDVTVSAAPTSYLTCPDSNHPHLIDLGLPSGTKWACCNVDPDASKQSPTNYGGYYAWGETETKTTYNWSTYIHCDGSSDTCHDLGSDISGTQYDVAHVKWGGNWVMPSSDQIDELLNCTSEWTTVNGVNGRKFTGSNGGSIFLPAAGYRWGGDLYGAGSVGVYWSSTQNPSYSDYAYHLGLDSVDVNRDYTLRSFGRSVRPVASN